MVAGGALETSVNRRPDGTWPKLTDGDRRPENTVLLRNRDIADELPLAAERLREQARRFKISAAKSETYAPTNPRPPLLRAVAAAFEDAAELLDQRAVKVAMSPAAAVPVEKRPKYQPKARRG